MVIEPSTFLRTSIAQVFPRIHIRLQAWPGGRHCATPPCAWVGRQAGGQAGPQVNSSLCLNKQHLACSLPLIAMSSCQAMSGSHWQPMPIRSSLAVSRPLALHLLFTASLQHDLHCHHSQKAPHCAQRTFKTQRVPPAHRTAAQGLTGTQEALPFCMRQGTARHQSTMKGEGNRGVT